MVYTPDALQRTMAQGVSSLSPQEKSLVYENSTYGIRMVYPDGWKAVQGNNTAKDTSTIDVVSFSHPGIDNLGTVDVLVDKLDQKESLAQYVNDGVSSYRGDLDKFSVIESKTDNIVFAGLPGYRLIYTYNDKGDDLKDIEIGTVVDDKAYYIQYDNTISDFDIGLPVAQKMIDSFVLITK
jgi:hypothetical protein